ncbi:MAG: hypothetical protein MJA29_09160, partial [Candidatus Omnitrophica bacterium]|nr:hypothetical protein [Candidatus Omnitrophota bacterium]
FPGLIHIYGEDSFKRSTYQSGPSLLFCPYCQFCADSDSAVGNHLTLHMRATFACGKCLRYHSSMAAQFTTHLRKCSQASQPYH